ncbi:MAG: HAD family hydrolase [Acidobacteria bacterium]|nr:HAD family hydrolase [Acidobacteriota bacterium]
MKAVFFDVDYTLIYPGPTFGGEGYGAFAARHGLRVEPGRFAAAVTDAAAELDFARDTVYRPDPFIRYAARVLRGMGADGPEPQLERCAREIYDEWGYPQHFALYDDVLATLRALHRDGYRIGLISNTHRCLATFQRHFALDPFVSVAVSSYEHGRLKPDPSIFRAALAAVGVAAGDGVMVGDSVAHDIDGARRAGMGAVLLVRSGEPPPERPGDDVPVVRTLTELPAVLPLAERSGSR